MATKTLHDLFLNELKDLYSAEQQLTRTLPKMARAATNPELKQGFEHHLEQTRVQVERLDTVFEGLDASPRGQSCEADGGAAGRGAGTDRARARARRARRRADRRGAEASSITRSPPTAPSAPGPRR